MQKQIVHIPVTSIGAQATNFIRSKIFALRVCWATVWLKTLLISQRKQFVSNEACTCFKFLYPSDFFTLPPSFLGQAGHYVRATKLPRMDDRWHQLAIETHEEPVAGSANTIALLIRYSVADKLFYR
jgi:hypothetical protein